MRASPSPSPWESHREPLWGGAEEARFLPVFRSLLEKGQGEGVSQGWKSMPGQGGRVSWGGGNHVAGRGIRGQRTEGQEGEGMIGDGMDQNDGLQSTRIGAFPQGGEDGVGHIFATGRQEAGERSFLIVEKLVDGFLQEGEAFCVSGDLEMLDGVSLVCQGGEFRAQVAGGVGREEEEASPGGLSGEEGSSPGVVDFQGGFLPVVGMA